MLRPKLVFALVCAVVVHAGASGQSSILQLKFGRFTIVVSQSWTAQLFHIVDQLAEWDESSHRAYGRWVRENLALTDEDRALLERHGAMRRARGWGHGFEQAFVVDDSIEHAATRAVESGLLTAEEADAERAILVHFAPKLLPFREQQQPRVDALARQLVAEHKRLMPWFEKLLHFTATKTAVSVPVFLVPNSEELSGGGEANAGRIIVEVPAPDPIGTLLHESLHVLLTPHAAAIHDAASAAGTTFGTMNECIAYALAPGLTDDPASRDTLARALARYLVRSVPASDSYVQSYMCASIIRPTLRASIDAGETLDVFLPKAVARWREFAPQR